MMKYGLKWMLLAAAGILLSAQRSEAQTYVKLNGLYALVGVINPAVEFRLSPHSTFQSEFARRGNPSSITERTSRCFSEFS